MITVFVAVFQQQHKEIKPNDLVTLPHRRSTSFSRNLPTLFSKYNNRPSNKQKNKTIATQITRYRNTEKNKPTPIKQTNKRQKKRNIPKQNENKTGHKNRNKGKRTRNRINIRSQLIISGMRC